MLIENFISNSTVQVVDVTGGKMPDSEYFKIPAISNSKLSLLNADQGGDKAKYLAGFQHGFNSSLLLGTCVHGKILSEDEILVSDYEGKPSGKLGYFIEKVYKYRKLGESIESSISKASIDADYYKNKITPKILRNALQKGLDYYIRLSHGEFDDPIKDVYVLPKKDLETCNRCVKSIKNNFFIKRILSENLIQEKKFMNEYAFFADFLVTLPDKSQMTLKLKGKADSIVIDPEKKIIYLNDVKTTSKPIYNFMDKVINGQIVSGVLSHHHYYRQFALYMLFLKWYCEKTLHLTGYTYRVNVWAVETTGENKAENFPINQAWLDLGKKELKSLLIQIAFYQLYGWDKDYEQYVRDL